MSADPGRGPTPRPSGLVRIQYLDFQSTPDYREYRFAIHGPGEPGEARVRISAAAFGAGQVRLQDGPDICYQRLLRAVTCGEASGLEVVTISDDELADYRTAHTQTPKQRPRTAAPARPRPPFAAQPQRSPLRPPSPAPEPSAETPPACPVAPGPAEGQRVSHATFGAGVVASSGGGHTVVHFDEHGRRTFATALVALELLSEPHAWETGPRGKNKPR